MVRHRQERVLQNHHIQVKLPFDKGLPNSFARTGADERFRTFGYIVKTDSDGSVSTLSPANRFQNLERRNQYPGEKELCL